MTEISFRSDVTVGLVDSMGDDQMICRAARVSTLGAASFDTDESAGLINFLMSNRHGTPFEHNAMTFRITAPIFVWREFMRHRVGFSYNEESGRYKVLEPVFYIPGPERPLVQVGKAGEYRFESGTGTQRIIVSESLAYAYKIAWTAYQYMLGAGVAKEVARMCLPVGTYSTAYVTCNARSMAAFLSLRTKGYADTMFPSYPQEEIAMVGDAMEDIFANLFPLTHTSFNDNGRVSP